MNINTACPHCGAGSVYDTDQKPTFDAAARDLVVRLTCPGCARGFTFALTKRPGAAPPRPAAPSAPHEPQPRKADGGAAPRPGAVPVSKPGSGPLPPVFAPPAPKVPVFEAPTPPAQTPELGRPAFHTAKKAAPAGWEPPATAPQFAAPPAAAPAPPPPGPTRAPGDKQKKDIPAWALVPLILIVAVPILLFLPGGSSQDAVKDKPPAKVKADKEPEPAAEEPKKPAPKAKDTKEKEPEGVLIDDLDPKLP